MNCVLSFIVRKNAWGQFHQCSTRSFYVRKLRAQIFCAYVLGFYFTGARLLAQAARRTLVKWTPDLLERDKIWFSSSTAHVYLGRLFNCCHFLSWSMSWKAG
jgi:hypothetical protein